MCHQNWLIVFFQKTKNKMYRFSREIKGKVIYWILLFILKLLKKIHWRLNNFEMGYENGIYYFIIRMHLWYTD